MSAPTSPAQQRTKRSRKSIAHFSTQASDLSGTTRDAATGKKSRSKSLGPGGLEALREGSGNKQRPLPVIRSILKPTIPLSPPKPIPPHTPKTKSPRRNTGSVSPARRSTRNSTQSPRSPGTGLSPAKVNGEASAALVALRTEEEQQRAARERDRQEAIRRRDERRKSLANRRVSFAPEATLHTWDVVEINEDATTSSEATNATRRQSNFTHGIQNPPEADPDPPSTPTREEEASSPAPQRDLHQKKRRRSSTLPPNTLQDAEALSSSPMSAFDDDESQQIFGNGEGDEEEEEEEEEEDDDDLSETDTYRDDESTAMDIDEPEIDDEDNTGRTSGSMRTDETSSSSSSGQLDARLRQAIEQATTQNLEIDVIQQIQHNERLIETDFEADQEQGAGDGEGDSEREDDSGEDDGMEMTEAVGGILPDQPSSPFENSPVKASPRRRSIRTASRRSSGASTNADGETMDFTTAVGGIRRSSFMSRRESGATVATEDEDMSMELTNVVGGVISRIGNLGAQDEDEDGEYGGDFQPDLTAQMDMTTVYGRILSPVTERTEPSTEATETTMDFTTALGSVQQSAPEASEETEDATATMTMDMTKAIGSILPNELKTSDRLTGRLLMEEEAEHGQLTKSPLAKEPTYPALPNVSKPSDTKQAQEKQTTTPSQSPEARFSTPRTNSRISTPQQNARTPVHQITPQPVPRPTTPSKTPPNKNVAMRRTSPRKLFSQSTREKATSGPSPSQSSADKRKRRATVHAADLPAPTTSRAEALTRTPKGASHGSPLVAELLDRRTSIGESAETFTPQGASSRGVHFADPRELEKELDRERAADLQRESGRDALEKEADPQSQDKDVTLNLRDMIQSLTPKKRKDLKGRKSLAVGSARGLLGKRPAELDDEDEDNSPKRIQGADRSPVKSIRLPAPPSKEETTGRLGKLGRLSLGLLSASIGTPTTSSASPAKASTPKDQPRFKEVRADKMAAPPVSFNEREAGIVPDLPEEGEEEIEPIQLQEFLNMINVRFMDLETTKRRHTIAPQSRSSVDNASSELTLEDCVVAGVSTVPLLELYQHSCRELKKYISEGRNIVREIEQDTFEENPALFREYMSAAPDMRAIMDNQFKNVKSHARLLSRAMWYEWRMKLLEGLKDGLVKIGESLSSDDKSLSKQEILLGDVVSKLTSEHQELQAKEKELRQRLDELASCDREELKRARDELRATDSEFEEKKRILAELHAQKEGQDAEYVRLTEKKQHCVAEIAESRQLSDEYRGWKSGEVNALRAEVEKLEQASGWAIATASDDLLTLKYRQALCLRLTPSSFQPASSGPGTLELSFPGATEPSTQQRFFLQLLQGRLASLPQASTPLRGVLQLVGAGWDLATRLQDSVSDLALGYITDVAATGDDSIAITASILLRQMRTRVLARFELHVAGRGTDFRVSTKTAARVVYGEELMEGKMGDFLAQKIRPDQQQQQDDDDDARQEEAQAGLAGWAAAVRELETKLVARGKRDKKAQTATAGPPTAIPKGVDAVSKANAADAVNE